MMRRVRRGWKVSLCSAAFDISLFSLSFGSHCFSSQVVLFRVCCLLAYLGLVSVYFGSLVYR